jgi:hypothetical protein
VRVGIDFDNTLVRYDAIFHKVALEQGLIPAGLPQSKLAVRDHLRAQGQEDAWTEMQGTVYGARLGEAEAFPGALEFLRWARAEGIGLCIVSHKTRHPFRGPAHDLHAAAQGWVQRYLSGLVDPASVFFELTKEAKVARIAALELDCFVDDLPELLLAEAFPPRTARLLFDPDAGFAGDGRLRAFRDWAGLQRHIEEQWTIRQ